MTFIKPLEITKKKRQEKLTRNLFLGVYFARNISQKTTIIQKKSQIMKKRKKKKGTAKAGCPGQIYTTLKKKNEKME